jgi:hypothetical protein
MPLPTIKCIILSEKLLGHFPTTVNVVVKSAVGSDLNYSFSFFEKIEWQISNNFYMRCNRCAGYEMTIDQSAHAQQSFCL